MGRRSKIDELPEAIVEELNAKLIERGFSAYGELAGWLRDKGYDISKSAVHRHGSALEQEFEEAMADARRTRALARAAREEGSENDNSLLAAATEVMQDNLLRVSLALKRAQDTDDEEEAAKVVATSKTLSLVARAFSQVGRMDIARQRWQAELATRMAAEAASAAISGAQAEGLTAEQAERIGAAVTRKIQIYLPDNGR